MGNSLSIELSGKYVVLRESSFNEEDDFSNPAKRVFLCGGGFGTSPLTQGTALQGQFVYDGENVRWHGYDVERLATDEEVEQAKGLFSHYSRMKDYVRVEMVIKGQDLIDMQKTINVSNLWRMKFTTVQFDEHMKKYDPQLSSWHLVIEHTDYSKSHVVMSGQYKMKVKAQFEVEDILSQFIDDIKYRFGRCLPSCTEELET